MLERYATVMSSQPTDFVDLTAFADLPAEASQSMHRRAAFYTDLASFGSFAFSGTTHATPVRCRKRPTRRACTGLLEVRRRDLPPTVDWNCPVCGASGEITRWEDGEADLRQARRPDEKARLRPVSISPIAHATLRDHVRDDPDWAAIVYGSVEKNGKAVMMLALTDRLRCATSLLMAVLEESSPTKSKRLMEVAEAMGAVTEEMLDQDTDVDPTAIVELMADGTADNLASLLALGPPNDADLLDGIDLFDFPPPRARSDHRRRQRRTSVESHRIKVTLSDVKPPVWRRLLVPSDIELTELHEVIQAAMGWLNCHLHAFSVGRRHFSPHQEDLDPIGEDSRGMTLGVLAPNKGDRLEYEYDFGDGWRHEILIEDVLDKRCEAITCLAGKRACPPEDCGGAWGYANLREVLANPGHSDHEEFVEMYGDHVDPERFDLNEVNSIFRAP